MKRKKLELFTLKKETALKVVGGQGSSTTMGASHTYISNLYKQADEQPPFGYGGAVSEDDCPRNFIYDDNGTPNDMSDDKQGCDNDYDGFIEDSNCDCITDTYQECDYDKDGDCDDDDNSNSDDSDS